MLRNSTRITIETEEVLVVRRETVTRRVSRSWCDQCGKESEFVPLEDVNRLLGRRRAKSLKDGNRHLTKAPDGSVVLCVNCLNTF